MCTCITCNQPATSCSCNTKTDNIKYTGPNLPCADIETGDDLTAVIQKLNDAACDLLTTTTTTTLNCRVWEAVLTQVGTNAPFINLVSSSFGEAAISSTYISPGVYQIKFFGQIAQLNTLKTIILESTTVDGLIFTSILNPSEIQIQTMTVLGVPTNDILFNTSFYIKSCATVPPLPTTTTTTTPPPTTTTTSTSTTAAPTTTTTSTLVMVYPVIATCCGQGVTHYINFTAQALNVGDVVTSISEGFLRGYVVQGPAAPGVATITAFNTTVIPNCAQWLATWAGFECDPI